MPQLMMFVMFSAPVWFGMWRVKKALKPDSFFDPEKEDGEAIDEIESQSHRGHGQHHQQIADPEILPEIPEHGRQHFNFEFRTVP